MRRLKPEIPMKKSYTQIVKQIEALKTEAEKLRRQEMAGVVERIREAINFYNLTAADLGLSLGTKAAATPKAAAKPGRRKAKAKGSAAPAVMKYRDEQGRGWVGRGKRPQWLRDALAAGKSLQDFAVK
jgi:DNA-binding protein H-NS